MAYLRDAGHFMCLHNNSSMPDYSTIVCSCAMAHADDIHGGGGVFHHVASVHLALHGAEHVMRDVLELHAFLSGTRDGECQHPVPTPVPVSRCLAAFKLASGWKHKERLAWLVAR